MSGGHQHLSLARRFVVAPGKPVADGVAFSTGTVVIVSRISNGIELYHGGIDALPPAIRADIEWIDALRPPQRRGRPAP